MSIKVGFVDYNLANFHANKFLELMRRSPDVSVVCAWGLVEEASQAWAREKGVAWAASPEAVVEQVDAVALLAPDNAEVHLALAERVFPAGKPVYVDKTFADSIRMAEAIIDLAAKHKTPFFSTSALRYAPALVAFMQEEAARDVIDAAGQGPAEWLRYGVHTVEPLVTLFGPAVKRLRTGGQGALMRVELEWQDGRTAHATVNGYGGVDFGLRVTTRKGSRWLDLNDIRFYDNLVERMIAFFKTGNPPVPAEETLTVIKILEKALVSREHDGAWIRLA